jgi:hypothetical protein
MQEACPASQLLGEVRRRHSDEFAFIWRVSDHNPVRPSGGFPGQQHQIGFLCLRHTTAPRQFHPRMIGCAQVEPLCLPELFEAADQTRVS